MHNEQVFTPEHIVTLMLDYVGYNNHNIRGKHIMDNSCGNGNFIVEIVRRYIEQCKKDNLTSCDICNELSQYIHGIEIDKALYDECISRIDKVVSDYGIYNVHWDIICSDALIWKNTIKCDYVIGNPPYCNVHHFDDKYDNYKQFNFANGGMSDLYLIFFELGISMLNENGRLCYITPNSWMTSIAGQKFRDYLYDTKTLRMIVQCGHYKIFKNATTFSSITLIDNSKSYPFWAYTFMDENGDTHGTYKGGDDAFIDGKIYLADKPQTYVKLSDIINTKINEFVQVKNGFATLNDKMFLIDKNDKGFDVVDLGKNIIRCVKSTTGEDHLMTYPYDENGKPVSFEDLSVEVQNKLIKNKKENSSQNEWYLYGRTQAINDVQKYKITVSNIIKDYKDLKLRESFKGDGVFGGLYILPLNENVTIDKIKEILYTETFINYIKTLGKHKNGGYFTFSSKDLEKYLNFFIKI